MQEKICMANQVLREAVEIQTAVREIGINIKAFFGATSEETRENAKVNIDGWLSSLDTSVDGLLMIASPYVLANQASMQVAKHFFPTMVEKLEEIATIEQLQVGSGKK